MRSRWPKLLGDVVVATAQPTGLCITHTCSSSKARVGRLERPQGASLWAPANLPPELVAKLAQETAKALKSPQVSKALVELGFVPSGSSPEAFKTYIKAESAKYAKLVKAANIRLEN